MNIETPTFSKNLRFLLSKSSALKAELSSRYSRTRLPIECSVAKNDSSVSGSVYLGSAELISSHRQRVADVDPHSDDNDEK
ncbi:MAG: hypothetical protein UHO69_01130, partial [Prevotella sp.]|nr:hypothetical protein [Prevotella sp.]